MHPIEQLRYVARAAGGDADLLTREAATALAVFAGDPHALLTGAKSLLARQPAVGPLWWMCSHLVAAPEPRHAIRDVLEQLSSGATVEALRDAIPEGATVVIAGWPDTVVESLARRPDVEVLAVDVDGQGHGVVRRLDRSGTRAESIDPARIAGAVDAADLVIVEVGAMGERAALTDIGGFTLAAVARVSATPAWLVAPIGRRLPERYWQEIVERVAEPELPAFLTPHEIVTADLFARSFGPEQNCPLVPELLRPVR